MKRNLFYLLPLLLTLGVACSPKSDVTPVPQPQGTFKGTFAALLKKSSGTGYDTIRDSNFVLNLTASSSFSVQAATAHHAASHGAFAYNGYYIQFKDSSAVSTGPGAKFRLNAVYQYGYDGTQFQLLRQYDGGNDTLAIQYVLKRVN
ncbi:hypothetical protein MTO98_26975 [Mucilaginibacter sp. SMC90]|uniref:hypothetical protein n=1 Tax=Mucilaginibacter sp. SMC90 TaxID=2929803 RepID=UPI001FB4F5F2|nr:hypothetical protein [Mucilaginibacter sp. SMC90]UOE48059.1 hypothetical protein MTO98_26975 [Mucilaginibacter sp. SMC90]